MSKGKGASALPKIKRCPHCDSEDAVEIQTSQEMNDCDADECAYGDGNMVAVCCNYNKDGCGASGGYRESASQAIDAWNTGWRDD